MTGQLWLLTALVGASVVLLALVVPRLRRRSRRRAESDPGAGRHDLEARLEAVERYRERHGDDAGSHDRGSAWDDEGPGSADTPPSWAVAAASRASRRGDRTVQMPEWRYQGGPGGAPASQRVELDPMTFQLAAGRRGDESPTTVTPVVAGTVALGAVGARVPVEDLDPPTVEIELPDSWNTRPVQRPVDAVPAPRVADDTAVFSAQPSPDRPSPDRPSPDRPSPDRPSAQPGWGPGTATAAELFEPATSGRGEAPLPPDRSYPAARSYPPTQTYRSVQSFPPVPVFPRAPDRPDGRAPAGPDPAPLAPVEAVPPPPAPGALAPVESVPPPPVPTRRAPDDEAHTILDPNLAAQLGAELQAALARTHGTQDAARDDADAALPAGDGDAPSAEHVVKATVGTRRYSVPGDPFYARTRADVWFRSVEEAEAAGFHT